MKQTEIADYCNDLLNIGAITDYAPNGIQIEGDNREVTKIATGVSISLEFIEKAIEHRVDMIIVHHGIFWNKDERVIRGPMRKKVKLLLQSGIALAAYHLPLDFHPELGNNARLARIIGMTDVEGFCRTPTYSEGVIGRISETGIDRLADIIEKSIGRKPLVLPYGKKTISSVAIITGGAQGYFLQAIEAGADCFITGEASEKNFSMSKEWQVHFISAGHYHTEKFGIQALGNYLTDRFGMTADFIDIPNPI